MDKSIFLRSKHACLTFSQEYLVSVPCILQMIFFVTPCGFMRSVFMISATPEADLKGVLNLPILMTSNLVVLLTSSFRFSYWLPLEVKFFPITGFNFLPCFVPCRNPCAICTIERMWGNQMLWHKFSMAADPE